MTIDSHMMSKILSQYYGDCQFVFDWKTQHLKWEKSNTIRKPTIKDIEGHQLSFCLSQKINDLDKECNKRIRTLSGYTYSNIKWILKTQNFQDRLHQYEVQKQGGKPRKRVSESDYLFAKHIIDRKDRYVDRYYELEEKIKVMSLDELNEFVVSDDKHWEGLE